MRPACLNRNASRRNERSTGRKASRLGVAVKGGLASVLAMAGLVVFATAASAHDNGQQSVSAVCGTAPTLGAAGDGATLTWTLYNNWPETETGTYSTTQGTLSTTVLSVGASSKPDSTPTSTPPAANQSFTQSLTATELAALSPSSTVTVAWTSKWTDGTQGSGTLTTTLAALDLPNGCVPQKTSPTIATTLVPPTSTTLGNSWSDTATVTGSTGGAAPAGSVAFSACKASSSTSTCLSGGSPVGTVSSPSSTSRNVSTYNLAPKTYTPSSVGTYCYYAVYTPTESEAYLAASGPAECFAVTAAPNFTVKKTDSPASGIAVATGSTIDYTVAIKNVGGGAGSATVTDVVPSSLTVNTTPAPACAVKVPDTCSIANKTGSTWTFTVSLAAGDTATATLAATVVAGAAGTITNAATITVGQCTTSSGCSSSVSNPIVTSSAAVVTPTATPPATLAATTSATTSPSTTTALASTGALLTQEWMVGLAALVLGSGLVLLARWRRRIPRHAASKK